MKNNNNLYLIGGALLLSGGAYIAYKRGMFSKKDVPVEKTIEEIAKEQRDREIADAIIAKEKSERERANSKSNPNSFASKVAVVQGNLGVAIDGIVGPQTRKALTAKFPSVTDLTMSNIDAVIAMFNAGAVVTPTTQTQNTMGTNVVALVDLKAQTMTYNLRDKKWVAIAGTPIKRVSKGETFGAIARNLENGYLLIKLFKPYKILFGEEYFYVRVKESEIKKS